MADSHREEIAKLEALYSNNPEGRVFTHLAEAYRKAGELSRAREILDRGLGRHADYASAHVVRGRVLMDMGQGDEARAAFRRVLELDRHNLIALRSLGEISEQSGDVSEALQYYRDLAALDPNDERLAGTITRLEETASGAAAEWEEPPAAEEIEALPHEPNLGVAEGAPESATAALAAPTLDAGSAQAMTGGPMESTEQEDTPSTEPEPAAESARIAEDAPIITGFGFATGDASPAAGVAADAELETAPIEAFGAGLESTAGPEERLGFDEVAEPTFPAVGQPTEEILADLAGVTEETPAPEPVASLNWEEAVASPEASSTVDLDFAALSSVGPEPATDSMPTPVSPAGPETWPDIERPEGFVEEIPALELEASEYAESPGEPEGDLELGTFDYLDASEWSRVSGRPEESAEAVEPIEAMAADEPVMGPTVFAGEPSSVHDLPNVAETGPATSGVVTETMAELYAAQGLQARAVDIYRSLLEERPGDERLVRRLAELERKAEAVPSPEPEPATAEATVPTVTDEVEVEESPGWLERVESAWTGGSGVAGGGPTPYAWTDSAQAEEPGGPSIGEHLRALLSWRPAGTAEGVLELVDEADGPWVGGTETLDRDAALIDEAEAGEDEDLEMFRSWLQSLKK